MSSFTAVMPPLSRLEAPAHRLADGAHEWGESPFHYVGDYYAEIWRQMTELGVKGRVLPS